MNLVSIFENGHYAADKVNFLFQKIGDFGSARVHIKGERSLVRVRMRSFEKALQVQMIELKVHARGGVLTRRTSVQALVPLFSPLLAPPLLDSRRSMG